MVIKDPAGSRQAQIELAIKEKKILCSLQKSALKKKFSPATSTSKLGNLLAPVKKAKPISSKPQDWICLKKLLEYEGCLIPNCQGTSLCKCAQKPENLETAVHYSHMDEEYEKYLLHMKQAVEQYSAKGEYSAEKMANFKMLKDELLDKLLGGDGMSHTEDEDYEDSSDDSEAESDDDGNIG